MTTMLALCWLCLRLAFRNMWARLWSARTTKLAESESASPQPYRTVAERPDTALEPGAPDPLDLLEVVWREVDDVVYRGDVARMCVVPPDPDTIEE